MTEQADRAAKKRAWANANDRGSCPNCGGPMGVGSKRRGSRRCEACRRADEAQRLAARDQRIVEMWARGDSMRQIADALGWTTNHLGVYMHKARARGADLPSRSAHGKAPR
jgi:DNA-binding CsgD family transcriptional regulator